MTATPARVEWRREGTGFPVAPPAVEQPHPVPARPRAGGASYTTPWVRAQARARRVDIPTAAAGGRVRLEDLPPAARPAAGVVTEAPADPTAVHVAAADVDVTALWRALGSRPTTVWSAVLARLTARRQVATPGLGTVLGVRIGAAGTVAVPDARHLSLSGLQIRIERGPGPSSAGERAATPELVLTHSGAAGLAWELAPPHAGAPVSLTVGAVIRRVEVVEVDGVESFAARSVLTLVLAHDRRTDHAIAVGFLAGLRADLESADAVRLLAELP